MPKAKRPITEDEIMARLDALIRRVERLEQESRLRLIPTALKNVSVEKPLSGDVARILAEKQTTDENRYRMELGKWPSRKSSSSGFGSTGTMGCALMTADAGWMI